MKTVYIAHPIGGDVENNIKKVITICREVNLTEPNIIPFVPYLSDLYALDDSKPEERERGLKNGLSLLKKGFIDEIWLYGDRIYDWFINIPYPAYLSEYDAPFEEVHAFTHRSSMSATNNKKKTVEKIFYNGKGNFNKTTLF